MRSGRTLPRRWTAVGGAVLSAILLLGIGDGPAVEQAERIAFQRDPTAREAVAARLHRDWATTDLSPLPPVEAIREEATATTTGPHPLPLFSHWNMGTVKLGTEDEGFSPAFQMDAIVERGRHLLPWFQLEGPNREIDEHWQRYYAAPLARARDLRLPLTLVSTQWESLLSSLPEFASLPPADNPNVVGLEGRIVPKVSPFGPVEHWRQVGEKWGSSTITQAIENWYPEPPLVVLLSNNEHPKLHWTELDQSRRFRDRHSNVRRAAERRRLVADAWIDRYRALQSGFRHGLTPAWQRAAIFVGYDAFGPPHFGRWPGWVEHSLHVPDRIDPAPLAWDGGSVSYYTFNWNPSTDFRVWSPQVEAMNLVFMLEEARRLNPGFWFELSVWDGHEPEQENDKRKYYASIGQTYTADRYAGMVGFGMWLLRPRVIREFRGWLTPRRDVLDYFEALADLVDRVHAEPVLRKFWRQGVLVANDGGEHPYRSAIPPEYSDEDRWYLLNTSVDPSGPWLPDTEIPVFALALRLGNAPARTWLIYAHSPRTTRSDVRIDVPHAGSVEMAVSPGGSYLLLDEVTGTAWEIDRLLDP